MRPGPSRAPRSVLHAVVFAKWAAASSAYTHDVNERSLPIGNTTITHELLTLITYSPLAGLDIILRSPDNLCLVYQVGCIVGSDSRIVGNLSNEAKITCAVLRIPLLFSAPSSPSSPSSSYPSQAQSTTSA